MSRSLLLVGVLSFSWCAGHAATHVQKRSDDVLVGTLEADVSRLSGQVASLTAQLTALQQQVAAQQSKLDTYGKTVAFYAWGGSTAVSTTAGGPIILKHVQTNVGQAYDAETGYFTAPVSGLYQFHATFMGKDLPGYVHAAIIVDSATVAYSLSDSQHGFYDNTGIHATVQLKAGQRVHFQNGDAVAKNYYGGQFLTYSGFLIRAD